MVHMFSLHYFYQDWLKSQHGRLGADAIEMTLTTVTRVKKFAMQIA